MSKSAPRPGASKARLVITAITLENRAVAEVVADYGVSKSWVYELLARYRAEGDAAFEPRSRRPRNSPNATPAEVVDLVLQLRKDLRIAGQLRHIGVGRTYTRTRVILLVQDLHVRIVHAATGELLRELIIDPSKDYQPLKPPK
jgi:transposase